MEIGQKQYSSIRTIITCFFLLSILLSGCATLNQPFTVPVFAESIDRSTMVPTIIPFDIETPPSPGFRVAFLENGATQTSLEGNQWSEINGRGTQDHYRFDRVGVYEWKALIFQGDDLYAEQTVTISVQPTPWALFLWLAADNNLSDPPFQLDRNNLNELKRAGSDVGVLVMWDRQEDQGPDQLLLLSYDRDWVPLRTFDHNVNSGDIRFFEACFATYLAFETSRKAVIFWNHGSGWIIAPNQPRAIAQDRPTGWWINIPDLAQSLSHSLETHNGIQLDILGMDACYMGAVEIAYELGRVTDYLILSSTTEPTDGWDYLFLEGIERSHDPVRFGTALIDAYFSKRSANYHGDMSLAMIRADSLPRLAEGFDQLSQTILDSTPNERETIRTALNQTPFLHPNNHAFGVDAGILAQILLNRLPHEQVVRTNVKEIVEAMEQAVVYERTRYMGTIVDTPSGISVYLPHQGFTSRWMNQYRQYQFAQETLWDEMIVQFYGEDSND